MSVPSSARRYHVREILGRGGFGTVYRAELVTDGGFGKIVALKVLHSAIEERPDQLSRLRDEARVLGLVRHRALVGVDALVRLDGHWTVVMEYVPGATLYELLKAESRLPVSVALAVIEEVADALETVWSAEPEPGRPLRLLHRDVKPGNVQLTDQGDVKVLDFGIARADFGGREANTHKLVYGSPPYLSPERLEAIDTPAGDVFALGATLAEMITGRRPAPVAARPQSHADRVQGLLDALDEVAQDPALTELVARTLAYDLEERPSMAEVRDAMRGFRKRHREPELRAWARRTVPRVQSLRDVTTGDLSGRSLEESIEPPLQLSDLPGAAARTWDPEPATTFPPEAELAPPPSPPPHVEAPAAPAPRPQATPTPPSSALPSGPPTASGCQSRTRGILAGVAVSVGALSASVAAAATTAVFLAGFLFISLVCLATWPSTSIHVCLDDVDDIDRFLDGARSEGDAIQTSRALILRLEQACTQRTIGLFDMEGIKDSVEEDIQDGVFDQADLRRLDRQVRRALGPPPP